MRVSLDELARAVLAAAKPGEVEQCLREWLGAPAGASESGPASGSGAAPAPVFTVQCQSFGGILALPAVTLIGPKSSETTAALLDTGASDVTINPTLAASLGLPDQGATQTGTAAGPETAWLSTADVAVAGVRVTVPVLVDPGLTDVPPLLGIGWWRAARLVPAPDPVTFLLRAYHSGQL